jgi:hypothetical protein
VFGYALETKYMNLVILTMFFFTFPKIVHFLIFLLAFWQIFANKKKVGTSTNQRWVFPDFYEEPPILNLF